MSRFRILLVAEPREIGRTPIEPRCTPSIPVPVAELDPLILIECGRPCGNRACKATMFTAGPRSAKGAHVRAQVRRVGIVLLLGVLMAACTQPTATGRIASAKLSAVGTSAHAGTGRPPPLGAWTITREDQGGTLRLAVGEALILRLPPDTAWDVQITDPQVIAADHATTPAPGEQGIYRARRAGVTELVAVALPRCAKDRPPCEVMAPAFRLLILVR
jgi:hypothetical protein